jgi:hypothetical protein
MVGGRRFSTCCLGLYTDALTPAYASIYPLCAASARCSGSSGDDTTSAGNTRTRTTAETSTTEESIDPTATNSDLPELTSATESLDLPTACENMFGMFTDCVADTPGFSTLPYRSQAPCYWYVVSL